MLKHKVEYKEVINLFQNTDVDPRELILLFKDLYETSNNIKKMITQMPNTFMRGYIQNYYMNNLGSHDIEKRHKEARLEIRGLLERLNGKYVAELRKDPNKEAEFMVSNFSDVAGMIRPDRYKLKDILGLVQMAIIKMYVEADNSGDMEDKVQQFFNEMGNMQLGQNQSQSSGQSNLNSTISSLIESKAKQLYIDENEMSEFLRQQQYQNKRITKITSALLIEHCDRPESLESAL